MPILSADGSLLSGLDVAGYGRYDVTIGNGILSAIYAGVTFDEARALEADSVSSALAHALQALGTGPTDISGCELPVCYIIIPDRYAVPDRPLETEMFYIDNAPTMFDPFAPPDFGEVWVSSPAIETRARPDISSATESTATIGWFARTDAVVPTPATALLIGTGLVLLAGTRNQAARSCLSEGRAGKQ